MPGLWVASAALGTLAAWTEFAAEPGLNWLLFALGLALAQWLAERPSPMELRSPRYQAIAMTVVLAGAAVVTGNRGDQFLLLLGTGWLAAVIACRAAARPAALGAAALVMAPLAAPARIASATAGAIGSGARAAGGEQSAPLLRGALIALAVVVLFIALLGEADPTLASLRDGFINLIGSVVGVVRIAFGVLVALAALGLLHATVRPAGADAAAAAPGPARRHTDAERMIILGSVAALFAAFLLLQLPYLFGNPGARPGSGVTLAAAVHRGFLEISIVVSLTAAILTLLERHALRGGHERWARLVAFVVLAECGLLLASAYLRVDAYERAYGYTVLRLYVRLYIGTLALVVALLGRELMGDLDLARFFWRAALAGLATLALLGYWNYSAWIVRANLARYAETGLIDVGYLEHADVNGLPAVVESLPGLPAQAQAELHEWILMRSLPARATAAFDQPWYAWNLRRAAALAAYRGVRNDSP